MGKQEVYRKMLTLNKVSVCVAILGLLVAVVIGILQLQRSKQSRQQPPTVKTTIVHTQDKTNSQSSQAVSPVRKATSGSHATQTPTKSAEPVQAEVREATGTSKTTPKSKRPKVRPTPKSTTTGPPE